MKILCLAVTALMAAVVMMQPVAVHADEEKVQHYEAKTFANEKEAKDGLYETAKKMADLAAQENLDVAGMEKIHEITYTTQNAVDLLMEKNEADMYVLYDALQKLHIATEEHQADSVRLHMIEFQEALNSYSAVKK